MNIYENILLILFFSTLTQVDYKKLEVCERDWLLGEKIKNEL
jgi:hypothetical protein